MRQKGVVHFYEVNFEVLSNSSDSTKSKEYCFPKT